MKHDAPSTQVADELPAREAPPGGNDIADSHRRLRASVWLRRFRPIEPPSARYRTGRWLALVVLLAGLGSAGLAVRAGDPAGVAPAPTAPLTDEQTFRFDPLGAARFRFEGPLGGRIRANTGRWLLEAPLANPGMLEMFAVRDRQPTPQLVPWAGEFVGKYLISAIQALHLDDRPELRQTVADVVAALVASQADDGYLGPFPKADRLRGNWDLWGHYHCMLALLMWHERTGDRAALECCRRVADLVCRTFLEGSLRVYDAGSHEMNMAIVHSLGWLYRVTAEPNYRRMMLEAARDWERAGDYFRTGLDGREFYQTPRPRWESLHDLQGLIELYRATGDARYRQAFEHHWRSIARWDRRNTGGFSSGEQATGNPYAPTAIETCCTVAWMALTLDMLRLTGDPRVADELDLATWNAAAGAQHPSGRWWTYNTPMDGVREASAHTIVFQSRAGTPELNCCSVNGPRSLGMLSEWAVMTSTDGLVVNSYGPGEVAGRLRDGLDIRLRCDSDYPAGGRVRLRLEPAEPREFTLALRIPAWASQAQVKADFAATEAPKPGTYHRLRRVWRPGDRVEVDLAPQLRAVPGALEAAGKVSLYHGPLLLAYDQRLNAFDENAVPPLDLARLPDARPVTSASNPRSPLDPMGQPVLLFEVPGEGGRLVRLCDFASAGAWGTRYRSWLAASAGPPAPVVTRLPADGSSIPAGRALFRWRVPRQATATGTTYRVQVRETDRGRVVLDEPSVAADRLVLEDAARRFEPDRWYEWQVIARSREGATTPGAWPLARFRLDPALPPLPDKLFVSLTNRPDGLLVRAKLAGSPAPDVGTLASATGVKPATGPRGGADQALEFDGAQDRVLYALEEFPEEDYSMAVWVKVAQLPEGRLGQVCSAWTAGMDDPLRVCVQNGRLFARIEAGQGYSTEGVPIAVNQWLHVAAVKSGTTLTLWVNGEPKTSATVPALIHSAARDVALAGNPHFGGNEFLAAQMADFAFYGRALSREEIQGEQARGR